ncbi:hypothetical protein SELMODRAFT_186777 [Selaginella moellendorffii]|uniref:Serine aminopeptidase S33 domain-containing protein n=1 Tax=Selaginella moellendorffii TaxID=88036 RepID=D8TA66_SELML|nr:caffeoylshikimate esterase [Selaginella moellendorffii]XP_024521921.1 caffeoylshikimate esterase [Selaginella moellendorffii]EFJ06411.1 hypothetical protein SELMODRAFT_186777 [Selaginella moellendorffii]|eukprot:XP_002992473.1 caffeoylshikimate esterase [Selaginella moellendorffii]
MAHPSLDSTVDSLFGGRSPEDFYAKHGVTHGERMITNARGMAQYTQSWLPTRERVKALVMVCHGYGADSGWFVQLTAIGIAQRGFAVHAIDHQGHGRSQDWQGLRAYVPDINPVVDDCIAFFDSVRSQQEFQGLPAFLYGESLGGALCLLIHLRQPGVWSGAVLNGAMCGISPKFKPPWPLENLLSYVAALAPTWAIVPTKDIPTVSFKEAWKRELVKKNPVRYSGRPRAGTALELLRVVRELDERFPEVTLPLLVIHGELDVVTDPEGSKALYDRCSSKDKTLRIYQGMWHQLAGEPPENLEKVFGEVYSWLEDHAAAAASSSQEKP